MRTTLFLLASMLLITLSTYSQVTQQPMSTQTQSNTQTQVSTQTQPTIQRTLGTATTTKTTGCISGDCNNGWGKWQYDNGYYDGFWENGKRTGYGAYAWDTQGTYVGFFKDNVLEGYGSYENTDGLVKRGNYMNGMLNGMGEQATKDLQWSQGIYVNHNLNTPMSLNLNNVSKGCVAGNCSDSYGQYLWENGDVFTGFFIGGVQYLGSFTFSNGDTYYGFFGNSGQFHGQGRFFFKTGGYYGGEFRNGNFHGKGYYHDKNYKRQIGVWDNGKLVNVYIAD